ncbi:HAMP domain-containing sensor histidine kinase [Pseudomonas sp. No.21]|uniref:sensor histidine kinase n=1 Tax=Pseudomonas TaxID=286 RepID=UPI000DA88E88|nr:MULTISPECIES: HAMP domain-containing sensor histidine kinase [Pseudomonas]MDW3713487.1 HAMP domain-containing sensor histidine kinase [Pseudomonas sp. 2023EL-01195]PZE15235.1 two-component sensor histidine kinase [Pseudomonas sp. 57B-090624]GJN47025.1 two-component sensor histidine kinase [Pseudomonas tohonis]
MRSLFWRILAAFWLALALVAGLAMLLGRALNQDAWILSRHPALQGLAETLVQRYEVGGPDEVQRLLEQFKRRARIDVQILNDSGQPVVRGTFPPRAAAFEARQHDERLPWRRLTEEYTSPRSGDSFLLIYRIPYPELEAWHRGSLLWPFSALGIALVVLTLFSLALTLYITRPLNRLRRAVHDLGKTAYQQDSLERLSRRRDELGVLAGDFNRMGQRLQGLIGSQRQLLRDVSHELRSPLARLRIALALAERAGPEQREALWPRLGQECDRLEALISEILALARLDAEPGATHPIELRPLLAGLADDARLLYPEQRVEIRCPAELRLDGWPDMLERALDNLLRNALRFNPAEQPVELDASQADGLLRVQVRDHGPGVAPEHLAQLGEPFYRAPGQAAAGHGLGLAIARRAVERHGGSLALANHPGGGFVASIELPLHPQGRVPPRQ